MLSDIDLSKTLSKEEYKSIKTELEKKLITLQRQSIEAKIPIIILLEGWDAAGKGSMINELILPMDPRGFKVYSINKFTEEEIMRPFLWRYWIRTPAKGRMAIFDRAWYWPMWDQIIRKEITPKEAERTVRDIVSFEKQLSEGGTLIIKLFLHISKKEQKRRFKKLLKLKATAWRVSEEDIKRNKKYEKYFRIIEDTLAQTDLPYSPWTIVEAHDKRFAVIKTYKTVILAIEQYFEKIKHESSANNTKPTTLKSSALIPSILDSIDLSKKVSEKEYKEKLEEYQEKLRELEHEMYLKRLPLVIVYEGWDAAGKGGNMRRLVQRLDPRGYEVIPVAAPNDEEKAHHYLWRFWRNMPKAGHIAIFDRSWYGRVLVERIEGFCTEQEWRRAYSEINEMERHLANFGTVILKFWLHIDKEEQLRRFKERETIEYKKWKITAEDWRNREKWDAYKTAVNEMLYRTSTPFAPWIVVESNCKWYARLKVIKAVINALKKHLKK